MVFKGVNARSEALRGSLPVDKLLEKGVFPPVVVIAEVLISGLDRQVW